MSEKKSALKATKPDETNKRLKLFLFGGPGIGKTVASISFPRSYIMDAEHGCDHYSKRIEASGSVLFQSSDMDEIIEQVRALKREKHGYRTVVIDPITTLEADLIEKAEKEYGAGDQRIWGDRDKKLRRLYNLLLSLDMNVIMTAHGKVEYAGGDGKERFTKVGTTHDGWRRLPYAFDLTLELERRGKRRVAIVRKTRIEDAFPDGAEFDFSYEEVAQRYGMERISREAVPETQASDDQIAQLKELLSIVRLEEGTVAKWLKKAGVEEIDDMPASVVAKCIDHVRQKIAETTGGASK